MIGSRPPGRPRARAPIAVIRAVRVLALTRRGAPKASVQLDRTGESFDPEAVAGDWRRAIERGLDRLLPQKQERSRLDAADAPAGPWMSVWVRRNRRRGRIDQQLPDVAMVGWK